GLGKYKMLRQEVLCCQVTNLHDRLNGNNQVSKLTKIRMHQGFLLASLSEERWEESRSPSIKKIWENNLVCMVLLKVQELEVTFSATDKL
ncbi:2849_t:CDS:1, partial [Dentiscutata heterogama]